MCSNFTGRDHAVFLPRNEGGSAPGLPARHRGPAGVGPPPRVSGQLLPCGPRAPGWNVGLTGAPQSPKASSLPLFRCRHGSLRGSLQGVPKVPFVQFLVAVRSVTWGEGPRAAAGLVTPASTQHLQGVDPTHGEVSRVAPSPDGDTRSKGSSGQRRLQGWATALTYGVRGQVSLGSNVRGWASGLWAARREPGHPPPWDSLSVALPPILSLE